MLLFATCEISGDLSITETPYVFCVDFVVFPGDVITANTLPNHDATKHWQHALAPTVDRMIPWASLLGNHDNAAFEPSLSWFALSGMTLTHLLCSPSLIPTPGPAA
jgi:hypothetical protein